MRLFSDKHLFLLIFSLLIITASNIFSSNTWQSELGVKPHNPQKTFEVQEWNIKLFRAINSNHTPGWDKFMLFFDTLGIPFYKLGWKVDIGISWILIPLFILTWRYRRKYFKPLIIALLLETLFVVVLKEIFPQPRPLSLLENIHNLLHLGSRSFPSGHTAMITVIAVVMMNNARWWVKTLWILSCCLIGYQRIYTGAHFPLDVLAGAVVGATAGIIVLFTSRKKLEINFIR